MKKIIDNISGVYRTEIDSEQNKVTVTGNVDAETLIRKLTKAGKHAELWPIEQKTNANANVNYAKAKGNEKDKNAPKSVINIMESGTEPEKSATVTVTKAYEVNKGASINHETKTKRKGKKTTEVGTGNHENIPSPNVHQVPVYPQTQPVYVASYNAAYPNVASNLYHDPQSYNAQYSIENNQYGSGIHGNYGYLSDENPNGCIVM